MIVMLIASTAYFALPKGGLNQLTLFLAIEVASVGAVVAGVRRWRPAKATFWYLLVLGQLLYLAAYLVWYAYPVALHGVLPFPSVADGLFIASYVTSAAALLLLIRNRSTGRQNRADLIDAAIIGLGLASVSWVVIIGPSLASTSLDLAGRLTTVAYPVLDIVLLSLAVRLAVTPGGRSSSHWLLLLWIVSQFAADSSYATSTLAGTFSFGDPSFAGWLLSFVFVGGAALHGSMRTLTLPSMVVPQLIGRLRLLLLAGASMVPIILMLFDLQDKSPDDMMVLILVAGALFLLIMARVSVMTVNIAEHERIQAHLQREIAERGLAEERMKQQAEELKRSNAELEQFAYVASHDLQEPLRMVASYTGLLKRRYRGKLDADADEFIDYTMDGVNRMRALISDLLTYSRAGREDKPSHPTDSRAAVESALANLQAAVAERNALVVLGELPNVMANPVQLSQVFQNLIGNGLKFSRQDRPEITVGAERHGAEWTFSVQDNGIGIDPEYRERIFLIFQRLHKRDEYPGTGIGLAICKKIIERHGGRIWVESEAGKGANFRFTLRAMETVEKAA